MRLQHVTEVVRTSEEGVASFRKSLRAGPVGAHFWELHLWLQQRSPQDLRFHLPLALFDDAGPISNSQSAYVRQYYSVLGQGADREKRLLVCTGLTNAGLDDLSWQPILDSCARLAAPKTPGKWGDVLLLFC